jgi:hypothetical protein
MNKFFLDSLTRKKDKNFKVEPIFDGDKNKILLDNFLKKQNFLNTNDVLSIIKINFLKKQPIGYILIENDKNIVGFLGTIYSKRTINEILVEHCYLHSWVVLKKFRLQAFKLILPILKKNIFISTYSPVKSLEGLYRKFDFDESHFYSKLILSLPFLNLRKKKITLNKNADISQEYLLSQDKKIFNDHNFTNIDKMMIYFDDNKNDNIFIIAKKRKKFEFIPILEIIYISDFEKFNDYEKDINLKLMREFKTILFKINYSKNNEIFSKNHFLTRITKKNVYYFNKPKNFNFDVLYSEFLN